MFNTALFSPRNFIVIGLIVLIWTLIGHKFINQIDKE